MIVRVIVLIAVVLAVLYLVDAWKRLSQSSAGGSGAFGGRGDARLVGCARCGVHVPASRALWGTDIGGPGRSAFCSPACRSRGAAR